MTASLPNNHPRLQVLVCDAGMDAHLLQRLLNGQRRQVALEFGLSGPELDALMSVQATTFQALAQGLKDWMLWHNDLATYEKNP